MKQLVSILLGIIVLLLIFSFKEGNYGCRRKYDTYWLTGKGRRDEARYRAITDKEESLRKLYKELSKARKAVGPYSSEGRDIQKMQVAIQKRQHELSILERKAHRRRMKGYYKYKKLEGRRRR